MAETLREKLNRIDIECLDNDYTFHDLRSLFESVAPKLSPQDKEEVKKVIQNTDDAETIAAVLQAKAMDKNESLEEELVDAPQEVVDKLLGILEKYGFVLDPEIKHENPIKSEIFGDIHIQVVYPDSYVDVTDEIEVQNQLKTFISQNMIDEIHQLDEESNCPITWNFGVDNKGRITGGLDVMKQWIEESLLSKEDRANMYCFLDGLDEDSDPYQKAEELAYEYDIPMDEAESIVWGWLSNYERTPAYACVGESLKEAYGDYEKPYFKAYVTNLGKYNEGALVGKWVEFPIDEEEFDKVLESIGIGDSDDFGAPYEEWFVTDYDCNIPGFNWQELGEYPSYESLQEYGEKVDSIDDVEAVSNALEVTGDLDRAIEGLDDGSIIYYSGVSSYTDLAYMLIDEIYGGAENLDKDMLERYIDFEMLGRDLGFDSYENDEEEEISAGEYWCGDENASDYDIGVAFVEDVGIDGVANLDSYFDYEAFGRDLSYDGYVLTSDGCVLEESYNTNASKLPLNEDWVQFSFKSGANPYIAKTEKEANRIIKKYGKKNIKKIKDGFFEIDDVKKECLKEGKYDSVKADLESIEKYLDGENFYSYEVYGYDSYPMGTSKIDFEVSGDWKHDHWAFKDLIQEWADKNNRKIFKIDSREVGHSDSDDYTAVYSVFVTKDDESYDRLNSMRGLFGESLNEDLLPDDVYDNLVRNAKKTYSVGLYSTGAKDPRPGYHYEINTQYGVYTKVPDDEGFIAHWFIQSLPQDTLKDVERVVNNIIHKYNCKEVSLDDYKQIIDGKKLPQSSITEDATLDKEYLSDFKKGDRLRVSGRKCEYEVKTVGKNGYKLVAIDPTDCSDASILQYKNPSKKKVYKAKDDSYIVESLNEASYNVEYLEDDLADKSQYPSIEDAYQRNELTICKFKDRDIYYIQSCPNRIYKLVRREMKKYYPELTYLYDESLTETFEDEYNNCFVEFCDGKPQFAYDRYKDASQGMFSSKMGDSQFGTGIHDYTIKYLKDGIYYDVDNGGNPVGLENESLKEDLAAYIQKLHDEDEYLWNLHDTDYTWLYDELDKYSDDWRESDSKYSIADVIRMMPEEEQSRIYNQLIKPYTNESLKEDTVKQGGKWVNKGKEGTHGKFKTKKQADAQRKAMFANGYKESLHETLMDAVLDRIGGVPYNPREFYHYVNGWYDDVAHEMDEGEEIDVANAIIRGLKDSIRGDGGEPNNVNARQLYQFVKDSTWLTNDKTADKPQYLIDIEKEFLNESQSKPLTWKEFYDLALRNYAHGGDGVVECWDESTFDEYVQEFGPITKESAMKMFNTQEEIWNDMTGPGYVDYGESLKESAIPWGVKMLETGYCNKSEWELTKKEQIQKYSKDYPDVKCVLVKTDTPGLKMWATYAPESLKEDYQHKDDEWGDPYTYDEVERELSKITDGFTDKSGTIRCYWEQEKEYGKQILSQHYKIVEVSDGRTGRGEDMSWVIAYSTPLEIEEDFTFEDNIKQANDLRKQNQALFDKTLVDIKTPESKKGNKFKFLYRGDK